MPPLICARGTGQATRCDSNDIDAVFTQNTEGPCSDTRRTLHTLANHSNGSQVWLDTDGFQAAQVQFTTKFRLQRSHYPFAILLIDQQADIVFRRGLCNHDNGYFVLGSSFK